MMRTSETDICIPTYTLNTLRVHRKRSRVRLFLAFFGMLRVRRKRSLVRRKPTYTSKTDIHIILRVRRKRLRVRRQPTCMYVGYSHFTVTRNSSVQSCRQLHAIL